MSNNDQEVFSFELNETLYFEKGQEVSEMIGISLDPEISIQSYHEYTSIRGVIELRGEYEKDINSSSQDEPLDFEDFHSKRYLEKVQDGVDGYAQFSHRFPVEISVPKYRIIDTNNITVSVESFDYELSNQNELRINSLINIYGISSQNNDQLIESEELTEDSANINVVEDLDQETFEFEIKEEASDEDHKGHIALRESEEEVEEVIEDKQLKEEDRWKYKESKTIKEFLSEDAKKDTAVQTNIVEKEEIADQALEEVDTEIEDEELDDTEEQKGVNFFTKLFRKDEDEEEEEEKYSQMRICIVQENDTLETIAERYEVPKLQLLKQNRLEDDDLIEGQLLSIPEKKIKK